LNRFLLTRQEFVSVLRAHGFTLRRQVGSHQQWTVDASIREFSGWLLNRMIHQSGLPPAVFRTREFFTAIDQRRIHVGWLDLTRWPC
jgi:hypothetical protein